ncbi:MAG: hypothetical protein DMG70_03375 [Acidobacteria bacterium]|nr:MAG: hypothetical protein DMG70_03375 [Acidobacteriota bacterium]PYY05499.1 MAG: hypothetical protein DMG69_26640 [Acidobacteriota bacterium]
MTWQFAVAASREQDLKKLTHRACNSFPGPSTKLILTVTRLGLLQVPAASILVGDYQLKP